MHSLLVPAAITDPRALPGLAFWGRADDVLLNSGAVETLYDKSGNGRDFSQGTAGQRPGHTASDAAYNNRAVMSFDGGDWLDAIAAWTLSQPITAYLVGQVPNGADYQTFFDAGTGARNIVRVTAAEALSMYGGSANIEPGASVASPSIVCAVFNGASSAGYVSDVTASVTGNPGTGGLGTPRIGAAPAGVYPLLSGSKMAELIVYTVAHGSAERAKVKRYLSTRYALSVTGL